ncbi:hypothetical protein GF352_01795|nr:hypothetical protein [archaeon]
MIIEEEGVIAYGLIIDDLETSSSSDYFDPVLNNFLLSAYETLDHELLDKAARKKSLEANGDLIWGTILAAACGLAGNAGMAYFQIPLITSVFNVFYITSLVYLGLNIKKGLSESYEVYKKRYEDSLV